MNASFYAILFMDSFRCITIDLLGADAILGTQIFSCNSKPVYYPFIRQIIGNVLIIYKNEVN